MKTSVRTQAITARDAADYGAILFAGVLYAGALRYLVLPSAVILTGTEGVAAALSYYFDAYWVFVVLYTLFQAGLLIFAALRMPVTFVRRTLATVLTVTVALALLPEYQFASPEPENERIILVLFGGLLAGAAKAIAFKHRGSTGDEDIPGAYFAMKYLKPVGSITIIAAVFSTAFGMFMALLKQGDFAVVVNTLMYTCIYIFASTETLNNLYHRFSLVAVDVVTRRAGDVGRAVRERLPHRTYLVQPARGGHTNQAFDVVRIVITREELPALLRTIQRADPECFHYDFELRGISRSYYIPPIGQAGDAPRPSRPGAANAT